MKRNLLILTVLVGVVALPAFAELTIQDASSREYLLRHNYSNATADIIERSRAAVNGEAYVGPPENPTYQKKHIKWIRNAFMYLDPALDDGKFMNHDVKQSVHFSDL